MPLLLRNSGVRRRFLERWTLWSFFIISSAPPNMPGSGHLDASKSFKNMARA